MNTLFLIGNGFDVNCGMKTRYSDVLTWGINDRDSIVEQIHIPCGKNIFNIKKIVDTIELENLEARRKELVEKVEKGRGIVGHLLQDTVVV